MIKRKSDLKINEIEGLKGGFGRLKMIEILTATELKDEGKLFSRVILERGSSIGFHKHINDFEVYYILKGNGEVQEANEIYKVGEGDVVYTSHGEEHSLINTGQSELEMIAVIINHKE